MSLLPYSLGQSRHRGHPETDEGEEIDFSGWGNGKVTMRRSKWTERRYYCDYKYNRSREGQK